MISKLADTSLAVAIENSILLGTFKDILVTREAEALRSLCVSLLHVGIVNQLDDDFPSSKERRQKLNSLGIFNRYTAIQKIRSAIYDLSALQENMQFANKIRNLPEVLNSRANCDCDVRFAMCLRDLSGTIKIYCKKSFSRRESTV
jgi:hypothetical protein